MIGICNDSPVTSWSLLMICSLQSLTTERSALAEGLPEHLLGIPIPAATSRKRLIDCSAGTVSRDRSHLARRNVELGAPDAEVVDVICTVSISGIRLWVNRPA